MSGPIKLNHSNFAFAVLAPAGVTHKPLRDGESIRVAHRIKPQLTPAAYDWLMANAKLYWTLVAISEHEIAGWVFEPLTGGSRTLAVAFEDDRDALMFYMFAESLAE